MKCRHLSDNKLIFWCEGCQTHHWIDYTVGRWTWNNSYESPTFTPSILVRGTIPITDEEAYRIMAGEKIESKPLVCHSFVTNGAIKYLNDCTHSLAGQIVELKEID